MSTEQKNNGIVEKESGYISPPERRENQPKTDVAEDLSRYLRPPEGSIDDAQGVVFDILEGMSEDEYAEILTWMQELDGREDLLRITGLPDNAERRKFLEEAFHSQLDARTKVIRALFAHMRQPSGLEKVEFIDEEGNKRRANSMAFSELATGIEEEVEDIQEKVFGYLDETGNGAQRSGEYSLPNIKVLERWRTRIAQIRDRTINPAAPKEDQDATVAQLNRIARGIDAIESLDPIERAEMIPEYAEEYIKRYCGETALAAYREYSAINPKMEKGNDAPRDPLNVVGRGGLLLVATFAFIMSAIITGRKMLNKEKLGPGDLLTLGYGVAAFGLAGGKISSGKKSVEAINPIISLRFDEGFQICKDRMGGRENAAKVTRELHEILHDSDRKTVLKSAISDNRFDDSELQEIVGINKESEMLSIFTENKNLTETDRVHFVNRLLQAGLERTENLQAFLVTVSFEG